MPKSAKPINGTCIVTANDKYELICSGSGILRNITDELTFEFILQGYKNESVPSNKLTIKVREDTDDKEPRFNYEIDDDGILNVIIYINLEVSNTSYIFSKKRNVANFNGHDIYMEFKVTLHPINLKEVSINLYKEI